MRSWMLGVSCEQGRDEMTESGSGIGVGGGLGGEEMTNDQADY